MADEFPSSSNGDKGNDTERSASADTELEAAARLGQAADLFVSTLDGLRDLLAVATPHLESVEAQSFLSDDAKAAMRRLSPEKRHQLVSLLQEWLTEATPESPSDEGTPSWGDRFAEIFGDDQHGFMAFTRSWYVSGDSPKRLELLNSSALISAVAALEVLVARVVSAYFRLFPDAIEADQLKFSLQEVLDFTSIEQAQGAAVDRRVDAVMFDGFAGWRKWLEGRLSTSLKEIMLDEAALVEIFQRRHCIVHSGGVASRQYTDAMSKFGPCIEAGETLPVDQTYFEEALDHLRMFGLGLVGRAFKQWLPKGAHNYAYAILESHILTLLTAGRWQLVARLTEANRDLPPTASAKTVMRVNNWIARKRLHGFEQIQGELSDWDVTALGPQFVLARLVLGNEHVAAIALMKQLVDEDRLNVGDLHRWPLFDELRDSPAFLEFVTALGETTGYSTLDEPSDASHDLPQLSSGSDAQAEGPPTDKPD